MIVQEVFGFVKRGGPGEMVRSEAEEVRRGLGVQGKGAAAPLPLLPRYRRKDHGPLPLISANLSSLGLKWLEVHGFKFQVSETAVVQHNEAGMGAKLHATLFDADYVPRWAAALLITAVLATFSHAQTTPQQSQTASADKDETANWLTYRGGDFKYPPGWEVTPQLYRTPPQEIAGEPESPVGLNIFPKGESPTGERYIGMGGRQTGCEDFSPPCKCFTIYWAVYTCATDPETLRVYDLLLTTIRNNNPDEAFHVLFPAAQDRLQPGKHYTLHWRAKRDVPKHSVEILVHDTSKLDWRNPVLDVKDVPDTGSYDWLVPASVTSRGPYVMEISFVVPVKPTPPALSAGRIYAGRSDPFYIY